MLRPFTPQFAVPRTAQSPAVDTRRFQEFLKRLETERSLLGPPRNIDFDQDEARLNKQETEAGSAEAGIVAEARAKNFELLGKQSKLQADLLRNQEILKAPKRAMPNLPDRKQLPVPGLSKVQNDPTGAIIGFLLSAIDPARAGQYLGATFTGARGAAQEQDEAARYQYEQQQGQADQSYQDQYRRAVLQSEIEGENARAELDTARENRNQATELGRLAIAGEIQQMQAENEMRLAQSQKAAETTKLLVGQGRRKLDIQRDLEQQRRDMKLKLLQEEGDALGKLMTLQGQEQRQDEGLINRILMSEINDRLIRGRLGDFGPGVYGPYGFAPQQPPAGAQGPPNFQRQAEVKSGIAQESSELTAARKKVADIEGKILSYETENPRAERMKTGKPAEALRAGMKTLLDALGSAKAEVQKLKGAEKKTLDAETAAAILQEAGGDKKRAREIARKRGYTF